MFIVYENRMTGKFINTVCEKLPTRTVKVEALAERLTPLALMSSQKEQKHNFLSFFQIHWTVYVQEDFREGDAGTFLYDIFLIKKKNIFVIFV